MKTKWDCLFALFELKEAKLSAIAKKAGTSNSSARQKLVSLMKDSLISEEKETYRPTKNPNSWNAFNIMKFCRAKGINYNLFLNEEFAKILETGLGKNEATLEDFKGSPQTTRKYLAHLSRLNLLFVISKKPLKVKFINDPVFSEVLAFFKIPEKPQKESKTPPQEYREIEALLKKFKREKTNPGLSAMEEEQKIEFTSASTQLEGNTFTLEESKELLLHDIIPPDKKLKEANEVKNYYAAVNYLFNHLDEPLSIDYVLDLHRIVVFNLGVKEGVRNSQVSIRGNPFYKVSPFPEIFPKLDSLCKKINEFLKEKRTAGETIEFATYAHNEFQHIHPFEDGNSRVTRLLWNYVLMRNGFPLINIYSNAREEYISLTKLARQRDDKRLNAFLAKIIQNNLYKIMRAPG